MEFFPASIASGDLAVATLKLSDPLDNPFSRLFVHPLWILWLQLFVPLLAFATFCDALAVVLQERWRRAYILSQQQQQRSDEPALIGWTVRRRWGGAVYHKSLRKSYHKMLRCIHNYQIC